MKHLGELEQQLLLVLIHLGDESYAVPMAERLEEMTGRRVAPTAAYVVLRRLEQGGFVTSRLGEATAVRGGKSKRLFKITARARTALRAAQRDLQLLWKGLGPDLGRSS